MVKRIVHVSTECETKTSSKYSQILPQQRPLTKTQILFITCNTHKCKNIWEALSWTDKVGFARTKSAWKILLLPAKGVWAFVTQRPLASSVPASKFLRQTDVLFLKFKSDHFLWYLYVVFQFLAIDCYLFYLYISNRKITTCECNEDPVCILPV